MDTIDLSEPLQSLHRRSGAIARQWYEAITPTSTVPLDAAQVCQRLEDLVEQLIVLALADALDRRAARSIGAALARLHYIQPEALASTQEVLARQFIVGLTADQIAVLHPRLAALLSELAAGFLSEARDTILAEQEQVRQTLVTECLQLAEALRKSEETLQADKERYMRLIESATGYIYTVTVEDGRPIATTHGRGCAAVTGYAPKEYEADPYLWHTMVYEEDRHSVTEQVAQVLSGQPVPPLDHRIVRRDGSIRWVRNTTVPHYDKQGHLIAYDGLIVDITAHKRVEEALERRAAQLTLLNDIGGKIAAALELERVLDNAARLVQKSFDYHHVALFTLDDEQEELVMRTASGNFAVLFPPGHRIKLGQGMVGWTGKHGEKLLSNDVRSEPHYINFLPDVIPTLSELCVPILVGETCRGVVDVQSPQLGAFDENDVMVFETLANQIAVAIENAQLYETVQRELVERKRAEDSLRRRAQEMVALYETSLEINSQPDVSTLLDAIVHRAAGLLNVRMGELYLIRPGSETLEAVVRHNLGDHVSSTLRIGEGLAGRIAQSGRPLVVEDYRHWEGRAAIYAQIPLGRALGVPLKAGTKVMGVLNIFDDQRTGPFNEDQVQLVRLFADQAAIAIEKARLYAQVQAGRERLQVLSRRLVEVQETERRSVARELHDEIGQTLTAVKINLQTLQHLPQVPAPILAESIGIVEHALQQVRNLSLDLRPSLLDDLGLVPAARWYVDRQSQRAGFTARFVADPLEQRLSPDLEIACFRVVQEALTNVVRHGHAHHVLVELRQRSTPGAGYGNAELHLTIRDDGAGFDVQAALERAAHGASLGLLGMEERIELVGGRMEIESVPGHGTEIRACFPLEFSSSADEEVRRDLP